MSSTVSTPQVAQALNQACQCRTINEPLLHRLLDADSALAGKWHSLASARPHLFSSTAVFLSPNTVEQVVQAVTTLERVIALTPYQQTVLARTPTIGHLAFGPKGVFMGVDFHLGEQGPRLIEVNTNAGGAMLNAILARANQACCEAVQWAFQPNASLGQIEDTFFAMFMAEWRSQRGEQPLRSVAIVDDQPDQQYLAPEFELFRQMFERRGLIATVVDGADLVYRDGQLWHAEQPIDLVYNRLTDFDLSEPRHEALLRAYTAAHVVATPHPRAHALYADKRNLVTLSDDALLASWGVSEADRKVLRAVVPHTVEVTPEKSDELWAQRRQYFFKPMGGYGAKGAYRGDKLTKRVWETILGGNYVAQALVAPSERVVEVDGVLSDLKFDLRAYAYDGHVQLMAARMYAGQTTNFRTPGGGFAPVVALP
ncbi:MAG: hypothetical protein EKK47_23430 [Burkholderiales bacterium]|jgi:hypothetical protein|nr:MAG: hypothetical protein EKK47_23430 [Burkholderiales bacterium]